MLPVEIMIGALALAIAFAIGITWRAGDTYTIARMLASAGHSELWAWFLGTNAALLCAISLFELRLGRDWDRKQIAISAGARWLTLIGIGWELLVGISAVVSQWWLGNFPFPPLFVTVIFALAPFIGWAWWDLGKLVIVADKRPEALGTRYDPIT